MPHLEDQAESESPSKESKATTRPSTLKIDTEASTVTNMDHSATKLLSLAATATSSSAMERQHSTSSSSLASDQDDSKLLEAPEPPATSPQAKPSQKSQTMITPSPYGGIASTSSEISASASSLNGTSNKSESSNLPGPLTTPTHSMEGPMVMSIYGNHRLYPSPIRVKNSSPSLPSRAMSQPGNLYYSTWSTPPQRIGYNRSSSEDWKDAKRRLEDSSEQSPNKIPKKR